jgi:hypothetical protein
MINAMHGRGGGECEAFDGSAVVFLFLIDGGDFAGFVLLPLWRTLART